MAGLATLPVPPLIGREVAFYHSVLSPIQIFKRIVREGVENDGFILSQDKCSTWFFARVIMRDYDRRLPTQRERIRNCEIENYMTLAVAEPPRTVRQARRGSVPAIKHIHQTWIDGALG
jgi:hypothetical protein